MKRLVLLLAAAAALLAGCGSDKTASGPAALAPAGSIFYGEANLSPTGGQQRALDQLLAKFPGQGGAGERVEKALEQLSHESPGGLSYSADIKPWLGDKAAFFAPAEVRQGNVHDAAGLIATTDEGKSAKAIDKLAGGSKQQSYKGHDYRLLQEPPEGGHSHPTIAAGNVDGFVVAGTENAFKSAVDVAEGGKAIDGSDDLDRALAGLPKDRLGYFYFNLAPLFSTLERQAGGQALAPFKKTFEHPYAASISAHADSVDMTQTLPKSSVNLLMPYIGSGSALLGKLPADAWLALAQPDLGKTLDQSLAPLLSMIGSRDTIAKVVRSATGLDLDRDILGWMGDFGVFVRGSRLSELNGALIIETKDPAASKRALGALGKLITREAKRSGEGSVGPLSGPAKGFGYTIKIPDVPQPAYLFQDGGRVIVAYGDDAVRDATAARSPLSGSSSFNAAAAKLGPGYNPAFYLAAQPLVQFIENEAPPAEFAQAKPYLAPLEALVSGTKQSGDNLESRFLLSVK